MLHTKVQGHWPFGSGEEDFEGFLPYMGVAAILGMWPRCPEQTFVPQPMEVPLEIWLWLAQRFWRRRPLKMVDGRSTTDDGRTTQHAYSISSPEDQWLSLVYILMLLYMYIAPGDGQTTHWGQMLMSTASPYHFAHLLQVLKQSLWSMILNTFLMILLCI